MIEEGLQKLKQKKVLDALDIFHRENKLDPNNPDYPDLVLMVLDASNIRKGLLFCSQVYDLKIPMVLILNMNDVAKNKGISVDVSLLEKQMPGIKVVHSIARIGLGKERVFEAIANHDLRTQFKVVIPDSITFRCQTIKVKRPTKKLYSDCIQLKIPQTISLKNKED